MSAAKCVWLFFSVLYYFGMAELVQIERLRKSEFHARVAELNEQKKQRFKEPQLPLDLLSKKRDERISVEPETPVPECVTCGVCCSFALIVPITNAEASRLNDHCEILLDDAEEEVVIERVLPRGENGHCVNLQGTLGERIGCAIYEERPQVCRDFDAGSDRCHEYRRMFGIEKRLSEQERDLALRRLSERKRPETIEDVSIISTGRIKRVSYSVADGKMEETVSEQLAIVAFLSDETPHELHTFEYGREQWLESDLLGLTLDEAKARIEEQAG